MGFCSVQNAAAALDQMSLLSYGNSLSAKPLGLRGPFRIHGASRANPQRSASRAQGADQLFDKHNEDPEILVFNVEVSCMVYFAGFVVALFLFVSCVVLFTIDRLIDGLIA